jgi:hypothetical protein
VIRQAAGTGLLAATITACLPVPPPRPGVDPQGAPISSAEIRGAMRDTRRNLYAIGLGLAGAAAGTLLGGKLGYEIGYARDIQQGCEDCGLGGLLAGAAIGFTAGLVAGGNGGMLIGANADRSDAIARVIRERANSRGLGGSDLQLWPLLGYGRNVDAVTLVPDSGTRSVRDSPAECPVPGPPRAPEAPACRAPPGPRRRA